MRLYFVLPLLLLLLLILGQTPCCTFTPVARRRRISKGLRCRTTTALYAGGEKSRMNEYAANFLRQQQQQQQGNSSQQQQQQDNDVLLYTHLIAVPMETCHELMVELESVQRAILYHCPLLVHSCIASAGMKLPLLYVE